MECAGIQMLLISACDATSCFVIACSAFLTPVVEFTAVPSAFTPIPIFATFWRSLPSSPAALLPAVGWTRGWGWRWSPLQLALPILLLPSSRLVTVPALTFTEPPLVVPFLTLWIWSVRLSLIVVEILWGFLFEVIPVAVKLVAVVPMNLRPRIVGIFLPVKPELLVKCVNGLPFKCTVNVADLVQILQKLRDPFQGKLLGTERHRWTCGGDT